MNKKMNSPDIQPFVGLRNQHTNQFEKQATPAMPSSELRPILCEMFDLVPVEDMKTGTQQINIETFLNQLMAGIKEALIDSNNSLFNKFIEYDQNGSISQFSQHFNRIMDGNFPIGSSLETNIIKLFEVHKTDFLKLQFFVFNQNARREGKPSFKSNTDIIYEQFELLMNLLLMNMTLQYKMTDNKKYYKDNYIITNSINAIRAFLIEGLNGDIGCTKYLFSKFMVACLIKKPEMIENYELATNTAVSRQDLSDFLNKNIIKADDYIATLESHSVIFPDTLNYSETHLDHFSKLIKMLRYINMIQSVHGKLIESSESDSDATYLLLNFKPFE